MKMSDEKLGTVLDAEEVAAPVENESVEDPASDEGKIMVGPLNLKDPQDLITIGLSGLIIYNTIDLIVFYGQKFFGGSS